jgi:hypothetical protein
MLGPDTREEFPAFNGWQVPAGRSQVETFTESDAGMVLDGDGTGGHGYHRNGLGIKSDEFPPGFGTDAVVDLTNSVFDHPTDAMPGRRSDAFSSVLARNPGRSRPGGIASLGGASAKRWHRELVGAFLVFDVVFDH